MTNLPKAQKGFVTFPGKSHKHANSIQLSFQLHPSFSLAICAQVALSQERQPHDSALHKESYCISKLHGKYERWLICSWPKVVGDELCSSCAIHVQFNSMSDDAESVKLITFVVFELHVHVDLQNSSLSALGNKFIDHQNGIFPVRYAHNASDCHCVLISYPQWNTESKGENQWAKMTEACTH